MKIMSGVLPIIGVASFVFAGTAAAKESVQQSDVSGWDEFVDGLRTLPARLLDKLPPEQRKDPLLQQEIGRIVLESLTANLIEALGGDGDHPAFVANQNLALPFPQPNADTVYRVARITPGGTYRIRGDRGTLRLASVGQAAPMPGEPGSKPPGSMPRPAPFDLNALHVDARGHFDVILSPIRPARHQGDWWELAPTTTRLLLRAVMADVNHERDPTISIERLDVPLRRTRPSAAFLEQRLRDLPRAVAFLPSMFVNAGQKLRAGGYVNKFKLIDASQNGGLAGQSYFSSVFELQDEQALLISVRPPENCGYWSFQLATESQETFDWHNNQTSLNDIQAKPDKDGLLRIVVSNRDPGIANWLDTAGHANGTIEGRWLNCDSSPVPMVEILPFAQLQHHLPPDTPRMSADGRERIIRDRRAALQQRPLW
jgi:hypothetical protein